MEAQVLIKITSLIAKMEITEELRKIDRSNVEAVGTDLLILLVNNLYKVENEIYELIAMYNKCDIELAKTTDIITFIKALLVKFPGLQSFLA